MSKKASRYISVTEAAAILHVSNRFVRELCVKHAKGRTGLPGRQLNGPLSAWLVLRSAVLDRAEARRQAQMPQTPPDTGGMGSVTPTEVNTDTASVDSPTTEEQTTWEHSTEQIPTPIPDSGPASSSSSNASETLDASPSAEVDLMGEWLSRKDSRPSPSSPAVAS
ncbi:MAG: hypothetical protein ACRDKW_07485 [Actinomycetota bacterium]